MHSSSPSPRERRKLTRLKKLKLAPNTYSVSRPNNMHIPKTSANIQMNIIIDKLYR
jgi:hypothetical protein